MTVNIPKDLEPWVFLLVGEDWPHVDEDKVRALAKTWRQLGADLDGVATAVQAAANVVGGRVVGRVWRRRRSFWMGWLVVLVRSCRSWVRVRGRWRGYWRRRR